MQETRQQILEILRESGESTVDDLVIGLRARRGDQITAVTVRHHLSELQRRGLIDTPSHKHQGAPGRPKHVYDLTQKAQDHFPDNYRQLAAGLLAQICSQLPEREVNVILEGVASSMATNANINDVPLDERIRTTASYLCDKGYDAQWERVEDGYLLHTRNCPYHHLAHENDAVCNMDIRLISAMLGVVPRLDSRLDNDSNVCTFRIPVPNRH